MGRTRPKINNIVKIPCTKIDIKSALGLLILPQNWLMENFGSSIYGAPGQLPAAGMSLEVLLVTKKVYLFYETCAPVDTH